MIFIIFSFTFGSASQAGEGCQEVTDRPPAGFSSKRTTTCPQRDGAQMNAPQPTSAASPPMNSRAPGRSMHTHLAGTAAACPAAGGRRQAVGAAARAEAILPKATKLRGNTPCRIAMAAIRAVGRSPGSKAHPEAPGQRRRRPEAQRSGFGRFGCTAASSASTAYHGRPLPPMPSADQMTTSPVAQLRMR